MSWHRSGVTNAKAGSVPRRAFDAASELVIGMFIRATAKKL